MILVGCLASLPTQLRLRSSGRHADEVLVHCRTTVRLYRVMLVSRSLAGGYAPLVDGSVLTTTLPLSNESMVLHVLVALVATKTLRKVEVDASVACSHLVSEVGTALLLSGTISTCFL